VAVRSDHWLCNPWRTCKTALCAPCRACSDCLCSPCAYCYREWCCCLHPCVAALRCMCTPCSCGCFVCDPCYHCRSCCDPCNCCPVAAADTPYGMPQVSAPGPQVIKNPLHAAS
jgi:hypothetical protein